jgi:hypothetical protein
MNSNNFSFGNRQETAEEYLLRTPIEQLQISPSANTTNPKRNQNRHPRQKYYEANRNCPYRLCGAIHWD